MKKQSTNPFDGKVDDSSDSVDDLDNALSSMDIDKDFNLWASFRSSSSIRLSNTMRESLTRQVMDGVEEDIVDEEGQEEEKLTKEEQDDLDFWKERLGHEEYFSHRYKPDSAQKNEMKHLMRFLGVSTAKSLFGAASNAEDANNPAIQSLFNTSNDSPYSILMKRGPILCNNEERELILLSHGFVLAKVSDDTGSDRSRKSPRLGRRIDRSFDTCELFVHVARVSDHWQDQLRHCFSIHTETTAYIIQCSTRFHKQAWLEALERVLVQDRLHSATGLSRELGWQHVLNQTSLHSAAVIGDEVLLANVWLNSMNKCDEYHHYTPLHYAVLANHANVVEYLLEHGANVEIEDEDGRTPMYYAHRDAQSGIEDLLRSHGAEKSKQTLEEESSELFREVAQFNVIKKERIARQESLESERVRAAQGKAAGAKDAMNGAMNAMHERGQRIEDLGKKTTTLQDDTRSFGEMTKALKEKSKQKKWYHL